MKRVLAAGMTAAALATGITLGTIKVPQELQCAADVVYLESRGESFVGQKAVAETVYNRVRKRGFPNTVCGVTNEKWAYATSYDLPEPDRASYAYAVAVLAADQALESNIVHGATHFFSGTQVPWWASKLRYESTIGGHKFYEENR